MRNLLIFSIDSHFHIPLSQCVSNVNVKQSASDLDILRHEFTNFICDGQYADVLTRILSTYLSHLDKSEQPGIWISGFFGSGKSYLVKMLQYLWIDFQFENGTKSRDLAKLPIGLQDLLKELSNLAKTHGGLHAAAGDLMGETKKSIRLAVLGILFKSVGLSGNYAHACFQMWLRDEGLESNVQKFITDSGSTFEKELTCLYVSKRMHQAILASRPEFASKSTDVSLILKNQFPPDPDDVSIDDMIDKIMRAVGRDGKLPLTVCILDEVQRYINEDVRLSRAFQDVQEQCCARLGANFLLIGTGQTVLNYLAYPITASDVEASPS